MPQIWGGADLERPLSSNAASRFFHLRPIASADLNTEDFIFDSSFIADPPESDELPSQEAPTAQIQQQPLQVEMNCMYYGVSHGALGVLSFQQVGLLTCR